MIGGRVAHGTALDQGQLPLYHWGRWETWLKLPALMRPSPGRLRCRYQLA